MFFIKKRRLGRLFFKGKKATSYFAFCTSRTERPLHWSTSPIWIPPELKKAYHARSSLVGVNDQ